MFGVYAGPGAKGVEGAKAFAKYFNAPLTRRRDFLPYDRWDQIATGDWVLTAHKDETLDLDLAIPLMTWEGIAGGETLRDVANGNRDVEYSRLAKAIASTNHTEITVSLGWEFNGNWYPWRTTDDTAQDFIDAYRRVWALFVGDHNMDHVKFIWCVSNGPLSSFPNPVLAWPGDRYVDLVGVDFYDYHWSYSRSGTSKTQRDNVFLDLTNAEDGLDRWLEYGEYYKKPVVLPEWGAASKADRTGGGDNSDFVNRVLSLIEQRKVLWGSYFEAGNESVDHRIATNDSKLPSCRGAFRSRMSALSGV